MADRRDGFDFTTEELLTAVRSKRFLAADRAGVGLAEIATWDKHLLREARLLVPIDVQALFVPSESDEQMVRLPMVLSGPDGTPPEDAMPEPFDEGSTRARGVHLHWAMPDALLTGSLTSRATGTRNRLGLPPLPDRWVVLRLLAPNEARQVVVSGWVLEADRAVATPLGSWTEGSESPDAGQPSGVLLTPSELSGTAGGSVNWSATYDAVGNRFAFHDPLDGIAELAPQGIDGEMATYLVAGWWKDPAHDPLDSARGESSLEELLEGLRWRPVRDWGDNRAAQQYAQVQEEIRRAIGLTVEERFAAPRPEGGPGRRDAPRTPAGASAAASTFVPMDEVVTQKSPVVAVSRFAADSPVRFLTKPWHLRSTLLHGVVFGVPVGDGKDAIVVDNRPGTDEVSLALGQHDDDVLAALGALPGATPTQRRDAERLLEAFTMQKLSVLGSSDGLADIAETEHASAFAAVPSGEIAATDRFLQRVQTGTAGGRTLGTKAAVSEPPVFAGRRGGASAPRSGSAPGAADLFVEFSTRKPDLVSLGVLEVFERMRSKVDDVLAPVEPREVERPAPRYHFPTDPLVGVRGAGRSLRHGGDGRGSSDGKLGCRWPQHTITDVQGVVSGEELLPALGSGAIPGEVLSLAREAALLDPYHDVWLARASQPVHSGVLEPSAVYNRLRAESALRFGEDGAYDGTTSAFSSLVSADAGTSRRMVDVAARSATAKVQARAISDELRRFSLYRGVDPDLVGVNTWSQPWVPLWLEWQLDVAGIEPDDINGWELGGVDHRPRQDTPGATTDPPGGRRTLTGRSLLTSGAATTLRSAVLDYLAAEDARDAAKKGEIPEATETALRALADAVVQVDVSTATLDGLRHQLLGFDAPEGLRIPTGGSSPGKPAPVGPPTMSLAGRTRLVRARLVDAWGRLLELPVADRVSVPEQHVVPGHPGAMAIPPRLLRAARWNFRLVDAATGVGTEGTEARVDQVDPTLQVSPVSGFLLPDHLDESLEVFAADGSPLGELLHEPVGDGVVWEIAPGRDGPPDAAPGHGLTAAQQPLGMLASGVVAEDARHRPNAPPGEESALSALLRAIDTTLWTIDTFASFGSEHAAGLVGRPIAVVRTQLRLELKPPVDLDLSDADRADEWDEAAARAGRIPFRVRIGEMTRSDDGVLGFFVDDDFTRFHLVDKSAAQGASAAGRSKGQLGLLAPGGADLSRDPISHPYIAGKDDDDVLTLHAGQVVTLTVLMHPAGRCHLTSGVLPRKALGLARDWVGPGLAALSPSLRTGPLMVETDLADDAKVRLPKVSVFGTDQNFWWRDTPATWRSDAILAATQTALLPDSPAELRDGWIRLAPTPTAETPQ